MHQISRFFGQMPHFVALLQRMGITMLFFTICRIILYTVNYSSFKEAGIFDFLVGILFDLSTTAILYLPYGLLFMIPLPIRDYKMHKLFFNLFFHVTNGLGIALNLLDIEYFKFTNKRSTFDLFTVLGAGEDFKQIAWSLVRDFWFLILLFLVVIFLAQWLYKKTIFEDKRFKTASWKFYGYNIIALIVSSFILFSVGRGGFGVKPISPITVAQFVKPANTTLALNTVFTMVKSMNKKGLEMVNFMPKETEEKLFYPLYESHPQKMFSEKKNVIIIVLESFGNEFVGKISGRESYTPFLDSMLSKSMYFENAFSNGKKSIEGIPAILSATPSLMDNPFISSNYGINQLESLPTILKKNGYHSYFFHGATNGSMRFDSYAAQIGFDNYFGRKEYNNDNHFDKTWGILDEYFNPWMIKELNKLEKPFFSCLFTLSSHHPYFVPKKYIGKLKTGPTPMHQSINYGDFSLRLLFDEAKKQSWYKNTLFVFVADHSAASKDPYYASRAGTYRVPIAFFDPSETIKPSKKTVIFQHIDIMPTIIDMLGIKTNYFCLGNSLYSGKKRFSISYLEGIYQYYFDNYMITFSGEKVQSLQNFSIEKTSEIDSSSFYANKILKELPYLKAFIQSYNRNMIENSMKLKP